MGFGAGEGGGCQESSPLRELVEMSPRHDGVPQRWAAQGNPASSAEDGDTMETPLTVCSCTPRVSPVVGKGLKQLLVTF